LIDYNVTRHNCALSIEETTMPSTDSYRELDAMPTPALVVDAALVRRNIDRLAAYSERTGIRIRPHTKTHKSRAIAELQLKAGAGGLTAAKVAEAQAVSRPGDDVLLAYPTVGVARAHHLATLAKDRFVHAAIDSVCALEIIAREANRLGVEVGLLVDIDVGLGRTGVQSPKQALELAIAIDRCGAVRLDGLMCYPGHVWEKADQQQAALAAVNAILD
jgi:D-serine deaminase-like pyridoxal phosphate-dependent protein